MQHVKTKQMSVHATQSQPQGRAEIEEAARVAAIEQHIVSVHVSGRILRIDVQRREKAASRVTKLQLPDVHEWCGSRDGQRGSATAIGEATQPSDERRAAMRDESRMARARAAAVGSRGGVYRSLSKYYAQPAASKG